MVRGKERVRLIGVRIPTEVTPGLDCDRGAITEWEMVRGGLSVAIMERWRGKEDGQTSRNEDNNADNTEVKSKW